MVHLNKATDEIVLNIEDQGNDSKDSKGVSSSQYASYSIDYWDTAGQEVFSALHPSYYYATSCCILCFDVTRKITYTHLTDWYVYAGVYSVFDVIFIFIALLYYLLCVVCVLR